MSHTNVIYIIEGFHLVKESLTMVGHLGVEVFKLQCMYSFLYADYE